MKQTTKLQLFWDSFAAKYDFHMRESNHYNAQRKILNDLLNYIRQPILDVACGSGCLIEEMFKHFEEVKGNDLSEKMGQLCYERTKLRITAEDASTLISYSGIFNSIFCVNHFYYLDDHNLALNRWGQLLSNRGCLFLIEEWPFMEPSKFGSYSSKLMEFIKPISPEEIEQRCYENGFQLVGSVNCSIDENHDLFGYVFSKGQK